MRKSLENTRKRKIREQAKIEEDMLTFIGEVDVLPPNHVNKELQFSKKQYGVWDAMEADGYLRTEEV